MLGTTTLERPCLFINPTAKPAIQSKLWRSLSMYLKAGFSCSSCCHPLFSPKRITLIKTKLLGTSFTLFANSLNFVINNFYSLQIQILVINPFSIRTSLLQLHPNPHQRPRRDVVLIWAQNSFHFLFKLLISNTFRVLRFKRNKVELIKMFLWVQIHRFKSATLLLLLTGARGKVR